jgi:hypothetical protein
MAEALGAGWRQPKVSKIETGRQLPTVEEIVAWARVTKTDPESLLTLRAKAAAEYTANRDRMLEAGGRIARQDEITALATSCTFLASYEPSLIPGRLQIPDYIRGLVPDDADQSEVGLVIAAKLRRQAIMYEPGREIVHIVGEAALRTRIGGMSVTTLGAQLAHLVELATLPGHTFGVVPFAAPMPFTPLSGWAMYDRDLVVIETLDGTIELTEPTVLARYSRWLDRLLDVALTGPDAAAFCRTIADSLEG